MIISPLAARLSGKIDARLLATVAFLAFATSYWMRSNLVTGAAVFDFMAPLLVQGWR